MAEKQLTEKNNYFPCVYLSHWSFIEIFDNNKGFSFVHNCKMMIIIYTIFKKDKKFKERG